MSERLGVPKGEGPPLKMALELGKVLGQLSGRWRHESRRRRSARRQFFGLVLALDDALEQACWTQPMRCIRCDFGLTSGAVQSLWHDRVPS
jgi:hypothetical protein